MSASMVGVLMNPASVAVIGASEDPGKPWLAVSAGRTRAGAAAAFSHIFELDINPLMVATGRCCAVDARLRIGD